MKQINLLPQEIRQREANRRLGALLLLAALGGLACSGLLFGVARTVREEIAALQSHQEALAANQGKAASADSASTASLQQLSTQIGHVNTVAHSEISWTRVFSGLNALVPTGVRLGSYSLALSSGALTATLQGVAPSNLSFADFAQSVKGSPFLTGMKVTGYSYDPKGGAVTFSLTGTVPFAQFSYPTSSSTP